MKPFHLNVRDGSAAFLKAEPSIQFRGPVDDVSLQTHRNFARRRLADHIFHDLGTDAAALEFLPAVQIAPGTVIRPVAENLLAKLVPAPFFAEEAATFVSAPGFGQK